MFVTNANSGASSFNRWVGASTTSTPICLLFQLLQHLRSHHSSLHPCNCSPTKVTILLNETSQIVHISFGICDESHVCACCLCAHCQFGAAKNWTLSWSSSMKSGRFGRSSVRARARVQLSRQSAESLWNAATNDARISLIHTCNKLAKCAEQRNGEPASKKRHGAV